VAQRTRVLRVIARMNVGGPAHHVTILSGRLDPERYDTLLVSGRTGPGEASADDLAAERGARLYSLDHLGPEIRPLADLRALGALIRLIRRFDPAIVHTHTAKAGFIGRLAAVLARPGRRPIVVHTYHGHVLEGYFGPAKTAVYRGLETAAARISDALIGVSAHTVDDLVRLGVAPRERFRVVPLGLDLEPFLALGPIPPTDAPLRRAAGVADGELLVTISGRLVPIKRVEVALEAVALARGRGAPIRLAVVGDGELRADLQARAEALGLGDAVHFAGYVRDMPGVVAAADIALLTSDNEGTPVALIESAAGARPSIATDVGGVRNVVTPDGGRLGPAGEPGPLADALVELAGDAALRLRLGAAARTHVAARFGSQRLLADIDALYSELLAKRPAR
jgi:glycosyltransferase involved in cell wall biosynthesis